MGSNTDSFVFYLSCDINAQVKLRVDKLVGTFKLLNSPPVTAGGRPSSLYVTADLCSGGRTWTLPAQTSFAESDGNGASWGTSLTFPVKYRHLVPDSQLALTVWERAEGHPERALGGSAMRLFSKKGRLKTGRQMLKLWLGQEASIQTPTQTPGKQNLKSRGDLGRLEQTLKKYNRGEMDHVRWLDHVSLASLERLRQQAVQEAAKGRVLLQIELANFPHAVLYQQAAIPSGLGPSQSNGLQTRSSLHAEASYDKNSLIILQDPEVGWDNPSEKKAQKLARGASRGLVDRNLKPGPAERTRIQALLLLPSNRSLKSEDRYLLWRFRWSLTGEKRALTKVLQSVDWADVQEARQAIELIDNWVAIDVADALELLSPSFTHPEVRGHAVEVLRRTDDEELIYYLLQLVQAMRYEPVDDSKLATFLVQRATHNPVLGIFLHWYLYTEWGDPAFGPRAAHVHRRFTDSKTLGDTQSEISKQCGLMARLRHIVSQLKNVRGGAVKKAEKLREILEDSSDLLEMRCALPLDPSVQLAGIIPQECSVFKSALSPLRLTFRTVGTDGQVHPNPSRAPSARLPSGRLSLDTQHQPVPPTDGPAANNPAADGGRYIVIYKRGDDLRQDQLVVQMFSLMDRLLKRENLDLRLTPYRVLPSSSEDGLVECVPSVAMARVLQEHKTIHKYFAIHNPDPSGPFGFKAEVLDTFVRSCAGYCVMTYILGVGDRHLDNLMLTTDGRLFHIDFGFIMGRDPKPFPPPMKLNKEMIDGMGGSESDHYRKFRTLACEAYNILRKSASLLVSLFHLMAGASIPDIQPDPEKAMLKLQEKLRLDVDEESAIEWMQQLINESSSALMPAILEQGHRIAQYWR